MLYRNIPPPEKQSITDDYGTYAKSGNIFVPSFIRSKREEQEQPSLKIDIPISDLLIINEEQIELYNPREPNNYYDIMEQRKTIKLIEEFDDTIKYEEKNSKSIATKLMEQMGWKEGEGLGKQKQGMVGLLMTRKVSQNSAVIYQAKPTYKKHKTQ